jgi:1,4-dihydroxy-6-naphthoate synthase
MPKRIIHVGHSPDSDDAFMFYALAKGLVETGDVEYQHVLQDIETLNRRALAGELEVSAVSIHAFAFLADKYALLSSGASMGDRYGPMVVARVPMGLNDLHQKTIAIPGTMTSAFLALKLALRVNFAYEVVPFDQIIPTVAAGKVDAGLIIHEGQLTYRDAGLHKVIDLGEWWHVETSLPLPLGGNVVRKDLGPALLAQISRDLRASIRYALDHRDAALSHAMQYARDLDRSKADEFVGMYVNDWTLDYGPRGRQAVQLFLNRGYEAGVIPHKVAVEFVE